ncbi:MAG TPA: phage minor capsid protein [Saprospiraceae bacterium]|nr:phage minor capsid protein [Saprospiraceae bacterium]
MRQSDYQKLQQDFEQQRLADLEKQRMMTPYYLSQQQRGVQLTSVQVQKELDNVYLNVVLDHTALNYNNLVSPTIIVGQIPEPSHYDTTKNIAILDKCSDYYCSVLRFSIPLDTVPLLIMPIVPATVTQNPQPNPNLTPFIVGIRYAGINYPIQLQYIPRNSLIAPIQNIVNQQVITPYYYVYQYQELIETINIAIAAAYAASPIPALFAPTILTAPYFFLDPANNLISLIVPTIWTDIFGPPLTSQPTIYINTLLETYLDSFNYTFFGADQPDGRDYEFLLSAPFIPTPDQIFYPPNYFLVPGFNPILFYRFTQEYSVLEYWTSLRKILITSNTLSNNPEFVPSDDNINSNSVQFPILMDFVPQIEQSSGTSRSLVYYTPSAQYKLNDLLSDQPLQKIDIRVYWQDRDGNIYPLEISAFQQAELKIGFFRKSLYKESQMS